MSQNMSGRVVIYGGKGALGSVVVNAFKNKNFWVCSIDGTANDVAAESIIVDFTKDLTTQHTDIASQLEGKLNGDKLDAVICVAGGWAGGSAKNADFVKNTDLMLKQSTWTSVITASISAKFLKEEGLAVFTGAQPCLKATAGMIGYGLAKASVHHLVSSLADPKGGLPKDASALAILPITLDTPMNRKWMPKADFNTWTSLEFVGELFIKWTTDASSRPATGSLVQLVTKDGKTAQIIE